MKFNDPVVYLGQIFFPFAALNGRVSGLCCKIDAIADIAAGRHPKQAECIVISQEHYLDGIPLEGDFLEAAQSIGQYLAVYFTTSHCQKLCFHDKHANLN